MAISVSLRLSDWGDDILQDLQRCGLIIDLKDEASGVVTGTVMERAALERLRRIEEVDEVDVIRPQEGE